MFVGVRSVVQGVRSSLTVYIERAPSAHLFDKRQGMRYTSQVPNSRHHGGNTMKDNGTAEWAYRQSIMDRSKADEWREEARKREGAGKASTALPVYSGLLSAFLG